MREIAAFTLHIFGLLSSSAVAKVRCPSLWYLSELRDMPFYVFIYFSYFLHPSFASLARQPSGSLSHFIEEAVTVLSQMLGNSPGPTGHSKKENKCYYAHTVVLPKVILHNSFLWPDKL